MPRTAAVIAVALLLAAPAASRGQQQEGRQLSTLPQAELDVVKVMLAQERAWNEGDLAGFASSYKNSPDTIFMGSDLSRGYESLLARYRKNYPDRASMGTLSFSDLEPRLLDDRFAILTGRFQVERTKKAGGNAEGIFSLVLEKTPQGWKIILDHTT